MRACLTAAVLILFNSTAFAQGGLTTSRNADFSTEDQHFEPGETVYVRVDAPEIDDTDIDENELRLRPASGGGGFEGTLENNFDGTYTAAVELPSGDDAVGKWLLEIRLRDKIGHEFEARLFIGVGTTIDVHEFEIEGLVTDIGDDFIAVAGRKIVVTPDTEVEDDSDRLIRLSDIHVGDRVHVRGVVREGTPIAIRIELKGHDQNQVEFTGMIEEILDRAIVMFGRTLHVTERTEIINSEGQSIPFSALEVGMMAAVKVRVDMDRLVLLRIKVRAFDNLEFEVKGFVTEIRDRAFALQGHFIAVTEDTEFIGPNGMAAEFADLNVGDFVQVHGFFNGDRVPVARRVKIEDRPGPREFHVEGFIRDIGDRAIAVAGLKIFIDENTRILGLNNEPIEFGMLQVGDYVEVSGFVRDDGTPLAKLIEVEDPDRHEIAVSGEVQRKGDNVLVVRHIPFEVTDRTEIFDERGEPFPFEQIEVGMFVSIKGLLFPATHRALALKIEVRTRRFVHLVGTINEIGDGAISVSGIRVFINDMTEIVGSNGEPLEFADLQIGQIVKVEGWKGVGGVVAKRIKVRLRVEDEVWAIGILEAVQDSNIVVLGVSFRVLPDTRILDSDGEAKPLGELEVGRPVRVRGELLADGTLIALSVKELDHAVRGINVVGPIESIGPGTIEVIGIHFFVDGSTDIRGVSGSSLGLDQLQVGQTVAVHGVGRPDGTRLALKIRLLDVLVAMGEVDVLASDRVQMFGVDFATDTDLLVLRDGIAPTTLTASSELQAIVEIRAATDEAGQMRVSKITLHHDSGSTTVTVDDGSEVPEAFRLGQAYPNPFNPTTTITLDVFEPGAVELAVYNLLGQRVATLVEQPLSAGTYTFQWNGLDAAGAPAASGLYLYRAAVGGTVQTRTMTLIK
ncbi:MAG: DUF5666 domain-containing protein [Rhodothermales bacterium]|nr:DUF5666 domain-containing protein [Rhodothermales bacterium]